MQQLMDHIWYGNSRLQWLLRPFSWLFNLMSTLRRRLILPRQRSFAVPIIVVGNLTVGGVGKTPLVIALAQAFQEKGLQAGIVSRGYGAKRKDFPYQVNPKDCAIDAGDEPLLLARKTNCPVVIAPNRCAAVDYLLANNSCDVIISDDGLQHYAMGRQVEIVVIDGLRGLGNGLCLPAGPLREPQARLKKVDFVVMNGRDDVNAHRMDLQCIELIHLASGKAVSLDCLTLPVAAVAGIGNPHRFFATLKETGIAHQPYIFPDHHPFCPGDLQFSEAQVVMTEKDAIKCQSFAADNWYYLTVKAIVNEQFWQAFWSHQQIKGHLK